MRITGRRRIRWTLNEIASITGEQAHPFYPPKGEWIMRMKRFGVLATTVVLAALALSVAARAGDQHSGTWKMNPAKSMYNPGPPAKSVTLTIVSDENGYKINAEGIGGDGNPTHVEYSAKFDGKDYTVTGVPGADMVSVKRIDSNTVESTIKAGGQVVMTVRSTVSKDGKTRTSVFKGKDAQGRDVNNVVVYDKQ
jgi:hypothetical protein